MLLIANHLEQHWAPLAALREYNPEEVREEFSQNSRSLSESNTS
jgi:hypothetical protein